MTLASPDYLAASLPERQARRPSSAWYHRRTRSGWPFRVGEGEPC